MLNHYEIRANYDADTIVMYQAYGKVIAEPALKQQTFISPFSFNRMTWIKPSFLWLMHRSNWGRKSNQDYILAVRIKRSGWEKALSLGVLTSYEKSVHTNVVDWREKFDNASVHVQWDPERSLKGTDLQIESIQVGLSRHIIREFVDNWIVNIEDITPTVRKIYDLLQKGDTKNAKRHLPSERVYPVLDELGKHLMISN
ncbi:MAG: DUF4291 domain-containing protein [Phototrophicaceae bacterium]